MNDTLRILLLLTLAAGATTARTTMLPFEGMGGTRNLEASPWNAYGDKSPPT